MIDAFKRFEPSKERNAGTKYQQFLKQIPENQKRYKCHTCFVILNSADVVDGKCGSCGDSAGLVEMCNLDHNGCPHDIVGRIEFCPVCGECVCPECGDHSVISVSRVTGYIANVKSFNQGKVAELKDRVRSNLTPSGEMIRVGQIY